MLLSAPPFEHTPPWPGAPPKVLFTIGTGRLCDWLSARIAAPPRSGPVPSQRLRTNRALTTLSRPPRSKMAPPPPPSVLSPVELPSAKVMFWTTSCGVSWSWQCEVVQHCAGSQVSWYRMRRWPPPLSVILPPPSMITRELAFRTFAVSCRVMVSGAGPQLNVTIPPTAIAETSSSEVQLAGVPLPMMRLGWLTSTACASAGTAAWPLGLPVAGRAAAAAELGLGLGAGLATGDRGGLLASAVWLPAAQRGDAPDEPHPDRAPPATMPVISRAIPRVIRT